MHSPGMQPGSVGADGGLFLCLEAGHAPSGAFCYAGGKPIPITVKGGKFLEAAAAADTIVFDKTGTLTHACPKVARVIPFGGKDEAEMLRLAACLEEHFPHSMANAVVEEAKRRAFAMRNTTPRWNTSSLTVS